MSMEFDPLTGDPMPTGTAQKAATPKNNGNSPDLSALDTLTRDELIALIRKVCAAGWGYAGLSGRELVKASMQSDDEAYESVMLTALVLAKNAKDWREFHTLASFWAERKKGKPVQPSSLTTDANTLTLAEMIIGAHKMGKPIIDVTPEKL